MHHLYLHVPFCRRRCSYCDFAIAVRRVVPADRYVEAVLAEYRMRRVAEGSGEAPFETVYLGGGTPSLLPAQSIARLLGEFPRTPDAEVTLEANPDDVTPEVACAWQAAGVNRVSLGVQSFDDGVLRWMHREHDAARARTAVRVLREGGIRSLSLDLIIALPMHLDHDVRRDLDAVVALAPDHISAYGLTVERRTPYARWTERGLTIPASEGRGADEFLAVHALLTAGGYEHYEISNYARPGARARHNSAYWQGVDYAGLGPSAHGFRAGERCWNVRDWAAYERTVGAGTDPVAGTERLSDDQQHLERVYLALRTVEGLPASEAAGLSRGALQAAVRAGWLTECGGGVCATPSGWLVLDELVPALTTSRSGG